MAKSTHIHKLRRLRYKSGNTIFFCCLPDCTYKTNIALALGKRSICHRCGEQFILSEYALRLAKPHCDSCHRPKDMPDLKSLEEHVMLPPVFPLNRELKQGEIPPTFEFTVLKDSKGNILHPPAEPSLAEKMQMEIHKAQEKEEEI